LYAVQHEIVLLEVEHMCFRNSTYSRCKHSTNIDENRDLTIGVSERRKGAFRRVWFPARDSYELRKYQKKYLISRVNFRWTPLAAVQRIRNVIFGGVRAEAVGNLKIKNWRKTPKTAKGGQCTWKGTPNPSFCPLL